MASEDYFSRCQTTLEVHDELMTLLVCDFLKTDDASLRFRMNCRSDVTDAVRDTASVEKFLNHLERTGKLSEGNYDFIKRKVETINVAITNLIFEAERKIEEIRGNALLVTTNVIDVDPTQLENETKGKVDAILLAVSEFIMCRSFQPYTNVSGLLERFRDLRTISNEFLHIWHGQVCKCEKFFGQRMMLQFIASAAINLSHGENQYDNFRNNVLPDLKTTLRDCSNNIYHVFKDCGATPVSLVQSSVLLYWIFKSVSTLDTVWNKYRNGDLDAALQKCFNSTEALRLLSVGKVSLRIEILQEDYQTYREKLEKTAPDADRLKTPDITEKITEKASVESTTKDIVKGTVKTPKEDPVVDTVEVLKLDHAKRSDKTTEMGFLKHFEKIEPSLKDPLSDPDMAQLQRGEHPMSIDLMKKRLYEINKSLSETPTVLSYLLHSGDKIKREPLYASVSLLEYDHVWGVLHSRHSTKIENLPDRIFCTSDEEGYKDMYKERYMERYEDSNTNSTCVIILGEAGCGKTSYCLHLLRQWCQGEELQKFDKVFYVDTSVSRASKTLISELISTAVFGNVTFSVDQVDSVLRHEKCLILIDGDEYSRDSLLREYMIKELVMEYCNCVFDFLTRPLHFMSSNSLYLFKFRGINARIIQLGLDEKGMASLYGDIMIESNRIKQSERRHGLKKGGDSQQIMNNQTLQEVKGEQDTALSVIESYLFQSKGKPDTQADIAQNPTDLEQLVKEPDSGNFGKEAETKPKAEKVVSKHDRKELEFYKIKGILERGLRENYDLIMKIPMLGSVCVGLLAEGKDLPRNFTNLYLCLIDKLVGGHESLYGGKGEKGIKLFDLFLPYENVHRHVETLRKLSKIAYNSISFAASQLVNYKMLHGYLEETEIDFAIRSGLLVPVQTLKGTTSDERNVRFLHKTIQDSLVSMYIVMEKEEEIYSVCQQLTSMDVIIDVSQVIMMVCGLNPNLGCRITRSIKDVLDKDEHVIRYRQNLIMDSFVREFYYLQLSWYSEYKDKVSNIGSDTEDIFYVSDTYVDDKTDKDTVTKTIVLLSDKNVIVTSLNIIDVPAESGLSNKVLNDFLDLNTSLESLYVSGRRTFRSIEPLSFPVLTVLGLCQVHIRPASSDDETTYPLLYHLPMLQRLDLYYIELNKRLLGLTSIEGRMPMLKRVYIKEVDMNDQSIELASDMRDIEHIYLEDVEMSPPEKKAPKYLASRLQISDLDPVKYPVETTITTEGNPLIDRIEALKLVHAKGIEKTTKTEYSKHFEKIEASLKDPFSNPDIAQVKRGEIPIYFDLMKKRLYEINKRLSQTPTVLSYLLQSDDKMTRESLYASVSLLEYHDEWNLFHSRHATKIENIPDHIFCTSDENHWKRGSFMSKERYMERYKERYIERYKDSNTNSTYVIILGEARCGKTSYCLHLLRQWCRGEELQKFDKVFYVNTSVLQNPNTSMSHIISTAVFENNVFSENQVDCVLRNEKCLILIDGDEYFIGSLLQEYEIQMYCNCVFVFLMRPIHFMRANSFYVFEMLEDKVSFIQLLGLDEKGMASLYSDVMIESNKMKQSEHGHEIKKGGDSQQIMNKLTLQEEKVEPDTALSVTESYLFQSKGESDTPAYIAQNPTDLEQLVKKLGSGDFAKEAETKPKTEKDVLKHDRKELEFYKIKGILKKGLRENYGLIMKIPMLGSVCVGLLAEGKDLPRNFTNLYLCLIDKLVRGHESLSGDKGIKAFDLFLPYENVHRHVETLCKLGNIAFNSIFSPASKLVNYKDLDGHLEETEIDFAIRTGLLIPVQALTGEASDEQNVRFLHKTIRYSLVSIYIVIEEEEAFDSFCQQLTSLDVIIYVSHVIMMVCGLNPNLGCRLTRSIKDVLDKDKHVIHHRQNIWRNSFVRELYHLPLSWYSEYKDEVTNIGRNTKDSFYVSDIYVDDDTDRDTINKTIVLLSDKNVIVTSLYIRDVPAENGLSDKVLNDFLALNTSLESMYIKGWKTYRSIEPLSFPYLTVLQLWYLHIQPASTDNEATKPLLCHLPMLQRLRLVEIKLNNRLLGFTSNKGNMRMLKRFQIEDVDMGDHSIELASDMTDIENIHLGKVKMSPLSWMKFIRSLINIQNSYHVRLQSTDIDAKSLDMVRTDKNFEVYPSVTSFVRVWPLT